MKNVFIKFLLVITLIVPFVLFTNCENNDIPKPIFDKDPGGPNPSITSITPSDKAFSGITVIEIAGENFKNNIEDNFVYFNTESGTVLEASENLLKVRVPNIVSDSVKIKVAVSGAYNFAVYDKKFVLEPAAIKYGNFGQYDKINAICMDKDENLYIHEGSKDIVKFTPDGELSTAITTDASVVNSMKFGPCNTIYYVRKNKYLYVAKLDDGTVEKFATLSGRLYDLDFDENGIIYTAGRSNILFSVKKDGSFIEAADYTKFYISAVRVYNGYVYVAGEYKGTDSSIPKTGIWRNKILGDGELGDRELVFDWYSYAGDKGILIASLTFDKDGNMYVGGDREVTITVIDKNGTASVLYEGVILPPAVNMIWGNSNYIYYYQKDSRNKDNIQITRVTVTTTGAPYYGRILPCN